MDTIGVEQFLPFFGVVVNRNDPQLMGRVQVRVWGVHPFSRDDVADDDLPWAMIVMGDYSNNYKPPRVNDWVFGFFIDGRECQKPILLGTLGGMFTKLPAIPNNNKDGFDKADASFDPDSVFQPWIPRAARAEQLEHTAAMVKNVVAIETMPQAGGREDKALPTSAYQAKYPYNRVYESESGHMIEVDDTPGSERVHLYHRSGSAIEMTGDGSVNVVSMSDGHTVTHGHEFQYTHGDRSISVGSNMLIKAGGAVFIDADGPVNVLASSDLNIRAAGKLNIDAGEALNIKAAQINIQSTVGVLDLNAGEDIRFTAAGSLNLKSEQTNIQSTSGSLNLSSGDDVRVTAGGSLNLGSSGNAILRGGTTYVGGGGSLVLASADVQSPIPSIGWQVADIDGGSGPAPATAEGADEAEAAEIGTPLSRKAPINRPMPLYEGGGLVNSDDPDEVLT